MLRENVIDLMNRDVGQPVVQPVRADQRDPIPDDRGDAVQLRRCLVRDDGVRTYGEPANPEPLFEDVGCTRQDVDARTGESPRAASQPVADGSVVDTPIQQLPSRERSALQKGQLDRHLIRSSHHMRMYETA